MNVQFANDSGTTCYVVVNDGGDTPQLYNQATSAYETKNTSNWTSTKYCIAATETSTGRFVAVIPSGAAMGYAAAYQQAGGSPSYSGDGKPIAIGEVTSWATSSDVTTATSGLATSTQADNIYNRQGDPSGLGVGASTLTDLLGGVLTNFGPVNDSLAAIGTTISSSGVAVDWSKLVNPDASNNLTGTFVQGVNTLVSSNTSGQNTIATSGSTVTTGSVVGGTYASTYAQDGSYWEISDSGGTLDMYIEFNVGLSGAAGTVTYTGHLTGNNDNLSVYGYNWSTTSWVQIGELAGQTGSKDITNSYNVLPNMVGTGANAGLVRIRFYGTGLTSSNFYIDQILCSYSPLPGGIANGSTITLTQATTNQNLVGNGWILDLNGQDVSNSYFYGAKYVTGTGTGTVPIFDRCAFATVTLPACVIGYCVFGGTFTGTGSGMFLIANCDSDVAGSSAPTFDFSGVTGSTYINIRKWSGGLNLILNSYCTASVDAVSGGNITISGDGGTAQIRGMVAVVDNSSGAVTIGQTQALSIPSIQANLATSAQLGYSGTGGDDAKTAIANVQSAVDSLEGSSGANTVTITVNDGTNPIQNASVSLRAIGETPSSTTTDASGIAVLNRNDATYTVAITANGYSFGGASLAVSGDTSHTYSMTAQTITPPTDPGQTIAYGTCYGNDGLPASGIVVEIVLNTIGYSNVSAGHLFSYGPYTGTSGAGGLVQIPIPRSPYLGFKVRANEGTWYSFGGVDADTVELPDEIAGTGTT